MSENKNVPKVRFPEFTDETAWEEMEFGNIISFLSDYTANGSFASLKENVKYYNKEEYAILVRTTDLEKKPFKPARFTDKRGYEFLSKTSLFGGEIVMANVGSIGKVYRVPNYDHPMTLAPNTYILKFHDFISEEFIYQMMLKADFERKLLSMVGLSGLMAINKKNLRAIKIIIPRKQEEQQKIADCLSSLDELIAAQTEKLELLKQHKKGLMQQLFPQLSDNQKVTGGGQTGIKRVPKLRFPEFVNDGVWEERRLGEVVKFVRGPFGGALKKEIFVNNGFAVYEQSHAIYGEFNFRYFIDEKKYEELIRFAVKENDLIMSCSGTMGKFAMIPNNFKEGVINQALLKLTVGEENEVEFIKINLELPSTQEKILSQSAGGAIKNVVSVDQLKEIRIDVTKREEQQKIAECLSSLDELITAENDKTETLKNHKKGLMQALFPEVA